MPKFYNLKIANYSPIKKEVYRYQIINRKYTNIITAICQITLYISENI